MIVLMQVGAGRDAVAAVVARVEAAGCTAHETRDEGRAVLSVLGRGAAELREPLAALTGVERVVDVAPPWKLASREWRGTSTVVDVGGVAIGGERGAGGPLVIAGPCAVESWEQLESTARAVKAAGARLLRGGAFKPRTSPYAFRGLGAEGLRMLRAAGDACGLPVVTEILSPADIDLFVQHADALQVGARNMQNFPLLDEVGRVDKPVVLKRGLAATIEELLLAAEYVLARGNSRVILCERGIRTFETATRNTPDLAAIPLVKELSHLPILFDPSHSSGRRSLVAPLSRAAVAAGADGLLIEVHVRPEAALCDGPQALLPADFAALMHDLRAIDSALRR
ncbi:MAG: 3-deoxy-7-phosphoheptulonate synthase [Planctomycetes bacterium]|nr:3-deoxy-7-phosphoheptulonate synthase [Planctomycetota bacterium]